ncbi:hypothetical protein GIB67_024714 [Kingdonia uniflora]|uniref:SWIM-type domain-containing protein n=1 Tax=Kingdonia uniflora TaxID=39325 RepID=A0A7J7N9D8_9MAGN|nr:hypothetical protein GIB67_024714 [Kingdonia uniflora]
MGGNTVDGEHRGRVRDVGVNTDNWSELDPDNLNTKEGYYSIHTQDGDDGLTQENIDRCDLKFRDLAKEYNNIFAEEEDAVHSVPPQPTYGELRVGMEWATVYEYMAYIRQWSIMNKFEYYQEKNKNYRVILFCIDENCEWMFYARRTTDGHTFTLRKSSNLEHTCNSGINNRLANATWVAKKVESVIRSVRTTTPVGIQDLISTQFGVDISYYTAWNAWSIYKEKIVCSYDEGYIMQPELCLQILYSNPRSIAVVSKNHDTSQWTGTCVMFKASIDGFLNGCRPVVGLDGCFLKGKYEGVCLSAIGLDGNNGLFPLGVYFLCYGRFCFRHMYKNMKKVYRGTHLESLVWKATRAYKQVEKKNMLDELKLDNPSAHDWLIKESFEHWARSHFDFTAKCEHITNNFSESFSNWIFKIRDKPLHKILEKLNLMLMKLMFDRRQKAKDWEEKGLMLVSRAQTHIDKLKRQYDQYRIEGTKKGDGNTGQGIIGQYVAIAVSGQRWRVNLGTHECDCHEWQVTGLPCVHVMSVIVPYRYSWANLQVDAGGERDAGRTGSRGRTGKNIVEERTSGGGGGARGGGRTGRNAVGGRTGGENVGGRTGTRGGGARGRAKQIFQAPRQSEGVTQISTSQAPRHSQGDTQVSQSQVRAPRQSQNQQSQAQASSSNPYKKEFVQPRRKWI